MSSALPVTTIISALAGAKARQYRQDAVLLGFAGLMAVLIAFALFGAFAVYVSESQGLVIGLLAAAGLALVLGAWQRRRECRTVGSESAAAKTSSESGRGSPRALACQGQGQGQG